MAQSSINSSELISTVNELAKERRVNKDVLFSAIEAALISAYKKNYGKNANVRATIDREKGEIEVLSRKTVVEEVTDPQSEMTLQEAREIDRRYEVGDLVEVPVSPRDFGRIAAQTAKQVVVQRIREAERGIIFDQYIEKENEIMTGTVLRQERGCYYLELGRAEGILPMNETIPGERYDINKRMKVYVIEVRKTAKGPQIVTSRSHPGLIKRLFELEVPEISQNVVTIKSIAREAGQRSKIAVYTDDDNVDPVGACVGPKGSRIEQVVEELNGERIDVIPWSKDPAEFIANALRPAKVIMVQVNEEEKAAKVIVPDYQLSLAIGKEGQNARLAAKLTGYKIDIKCQSQIVDNLFGPETPGEGGNFDEAPLDFEGPDFNE